MEPIESPVEMERRHVREGEARIARHLRVMDGLICLGSWSAWLYADEFLAQLEEYQRVAVTYLADAIEREQARTRSR
jgi:hypothetical protein